MLFNPINEKLFGRHSRWSRYQSQKKKINPLTWSYNIDPTFFPKFPSKVFRILSINLQRFPKTYYSMAVIQSVICSSLPHLVFIQELSRTNSLKELCDFVNWFQSDRHYSFRYGISTSRNLQIATLFDSKTCHFISFENLFRSYVSEKQNFNRPVLFVKLEFKSFDVWSYNLHMPSHSKIGGSQMIVNSFNVLYDYFNSVSSRRLYLVGGDFNTSSSSSLYSTYLPLFTTSFGTYSNNSDIICNNSNAENILIASKPKQLKWNTKTYNQITDSDWLYYVSDHFPIICDYTIL